MLEFWFLTVQLHTLSRLTPAYAALIAAATVVCVALAFRHRPRRDSFAWVAFNAVVLCYLLWIEVFVSRGLPPAGNIVRVATPFAIAIVFAFSITSIQQIARLSKIYLLVVMLGAMSMYYQVLFGPIMWFADASSRAGVTRYASLLGSLTIFGTAAPFALLCLARYVKAPAGFAAGTIVLLFSAMLSLQKAALFGMAIALPFVLALIPRRTLLTTVLAVLLVVLALVQAIPVEYAPYVEAGVRYFFRPSYESDDVSILQSIMDRLFGLPTELVDAWGWRALIAGVGLRGAGGVFGFDTLPMAHNGLIDYIAVGGILFLSYGLWICVRLVLLAFSLPYLARDQIIDRHDAWFLAGLTTLYLANLPFSSGLQFHPNVSWVFGLLMAVDIVLRRQRQRAGGNSELAVAHTH